MLHVISTDEQRGHTAAIKWERNHQRLDPVPWIIHAAILAGAAKKRETRSRLLHLVRGLAAL
jgi:hypothetical protein